MNYVRAGRITKDLKWTYQSGYGLLDITINRSKPEKDLRDIAAAKSASSVSYPKCQLCAENAGFAGNLNHPARQNLRPVPLTINGEKWQLQYSPYGFYNEHCIVFNQQHIPMKIVEVVFEKLFDILDYLPHYFVGSNADLPIVGGSILSHEHFQGGNYTFAMENAPFEKDIILPQFSNIQTGIVKCPMSVIKVKSKNRLELGKVCTYILNQWRRYSDPDAGIYAETDDVPHNTITPIARMKNSVYECDLVLRNNLTTEERPLGVFHPNPSLHHIKKENIGLVEVMGLAVLLSRLAAELEALKAAMISGEDLTADTKMASHAAWAKEVMERHPEFNTENAYEILYAEVGAVFEQVLLDAGVFIRDIDGQKAFQKFVQTLKGVAKENGLLISFDPNLREPLWNSLEDARNEIEYGLSKCDILKISDNELEFITGTDDDYEGVKRLREQYDISLIFVTLGKDGSIAYYKDIIVEKTTFLNVKAIEKNRAGDTFEGCALNYILEHGTDNLTEENLAELLTFVNINYGRFPNSLAPIQKNISQKAIPHACTQGIAHTFSFSEDIFIWLSSLPSVLFLTYLHNFIYSILKYKFYYNLYDKSYIK